MDPLFRELTMRQRVSPHRYTTTTLLRLGDALTYFFHVHESVQVSPEIYKRP